ncbi:hypothetical protein [Microvirga brassicacearum]|uniref:Uncharacterized protein n=1 Tax=Microvirga brassicacearum TaxID=2580413 RepID=A0A5N3PE78_9HYPH|nr:hypothetical protein [Microvirga brassicacearum]KAB0268036.1 hypothetical protein FEZ63_06620 [Microvirga brassicacearum]
MRSGGAMEMAGNLPGIGIGVATLDPGTGDNPTATGFSIVAATWWTLSGIVAAFAGGYAAGRLAGNPRESTRRLAWPNHLGR